MFVVSINLFTCSSIYPNLKLYPSVLRPKTHVIVDVNVVVRLGKFVSILMAEDTDTHGCFIASKNDLRVRYQ